MIQIKDVSKLYRLGQINSGTLRNDAINWWSKIFKKDHSNLLELNDNQEKIAKEKYKWALKNINIDVNKGTILGIIGKNGAGKSTLLKILSRITAPSKGTINIKGRVASLLEIGTGFHGELSGLENIYLNGAILGMNRKEIDNKLKSIVDFSGVNRYINTPVKRYSSGMYVRLAFAVAAHLDSNILLIDEVLAVGDAEFQKKCLDKMGNIANGGRTILFISHNLKAIANLCNRVVLLENGRINGIGKPQEMIQKYLENTSNETPLTNEVDLAKISQEGNGSVTIEKIRTMGGQLPKHIFDISEEIIIQFDYYNHMEGNRLCVYVLIQNENEEVIYTSGNLESLSIKKDKWFNKPHPIGMFQSQCVIPGNFINSGNYIISINIQHDVKQHAALSGPALMIKITDETGSISELSQEWPGYIRKKIHWETKPLLQEEGNIN